MTPRKRWPNEANWAREDSIVLAQEIEQLATPIADGEPMNEVERIMRAGQIARRALKIASALQSVGPQEFKEEPHPTAVAVTLPK